MNINEQFTYEVQKIALQNSLQYTGKTNVKIVLAKILSNKPELRNKIKEIMPEIIRIVQDTNNLSSDEQKRIAKEKFPDILTKPKKTQTQQDTLLPPLPDATNGNVVTRFPPEPNGYPHIGHAKAAIINEEYAKMYNGKLILRFDDTNPQAERLEYYAAIKVGLDWLGIKYDSVKNTSDDMELIYDKGKKILEMNHAYICMCKQEKIKENRRNAISCKCKSKDQDLEHWDNMLAKFKPGKAIIRFRGDMESENTVMRDPTLFRIIEESHPLVGDKYRVWPSYDFAVAIEDSIDGVTHAFRTKEYELRNELYYKILDILDMRKPIMTEFARLGFAGVPVSKRVLKKMIEENKVSWYDDPRLFTLVALKRRGMRPSAIRKFILSLGFTKSDTFAPFDSLESFNRKEIDSHSIRLHMVIDPIRVRIKNAPQQIEISNHPSDKTLKRKVEIGSQGIVYVSQEDVKNISSGQQLRLIGFGNIEIQNISDEIYAQYLKEDNLNVQKIQWIPEKNNHKIKVLTPKTLFINDKFNENSLEEKIAYTEAEFTKLENDSEIQFVRFGYYRKDSQNQVIFTHK